MKTIILNHYYPHLTERPILSPKAQAKRKREIESCLFEVFIKYAPGRAQMV